jgi:rubrerythrin
MSKKLTTIEFIAKAKSVHGDKYDYSLVDYKYSKLKIIIICKKHGQFFQKPNCHLNNQGCPICGANNRITSNVKTIDKFLSEAKSIHGDKYDYSLADYVNNHKNIIIICSKHGEFLQAPKPHLNGQGCPKCAKINLGDKLHLTTLNFIERARKIHGDRYDYSLVDYHNAHTMIKIICKEHGVFMQKSSNHTNEGAGCPICKQSKGEREISKFLNDNNIEYIAEKTFCNCKDKRCLPFDFYLPKYNVLIEYDGIQHFEAANFYGGECGFLIRQKSDKIKTEFAKANDIKLIRIAYNENVEEKLNKIFELTLV